MRYLLSSAALCLVLAACGGEGYDAGQYDVTGRWTGSAAVADSARYDFDLDLSQDEEDISGSGEVRVAGETIPVTVRGTFAFPGVGLTLSAPGYTPLAFDAAFRRDTVQAAKDSVPAVLRENPRVITGTLNGSALDNVRLVIERDTL